MSYDPDKHHRQSIRLKGYDYSQPGGYFITLLAKDRKAIFGKIEGSQVRLNRISKLVKAYWLKIANHFDKTRLDAFVLMPSHLRGIIIIEGSPGRGEASPLIFFARSFHKGCFASPIQRSGASQQ
jgi:putative transposase